MGKQSRRVAVQARKGRQEAKITERVSAVSITDSKSSNDDFLVA